MSFDKKSSLNPKNLLNLVYTVTRGIYFLNNADFTMKNSTLIDSIYIKLKVVK